MGDLGGIDTQALQTGSYMFCEQYGASTKIAVRQMRLRLAVVGRENQLWLVYIRTRVEWAEDPE